MMKFITLISSAMIIWKNGILKTGGLNTGQETSEFLEYHKITNRPKGRSSTKEPSLM